MEDQIEVPIVANLQDVKGLKELTAQLSSAYVSGVSSAINKLRTELSQAEKTHGKASSQARAKSNEIARQERLANHVKRQSEHALSYIDQIEKIRQAGLTSYNAEQYLASALGLRQAFRGLTGQDITGKVGPETRKSIAFGQELINTQVNTGRGLIRTEAAYEKARDAWLAFNTSKRFGGNLLAYLEDENIPLAEKQRAARKGLGLATRAYNLGTEGGILTKKQTKENQKTIEYLSEIAEASAQTAESTSFIGKFFSVSPIAAMNFGIRTGNELSNAVASWYANRVDPYTQQRRWFASKIQQAGGAVGGGLGMLLGGAIGTAVPIIGPAIGAAVGGALGGGTGAWIGGSKTRAIEAAESSQEDALERLRMRGLYRNTLGATFAQMASKTGYVDASDIEGLASASNTFQAAAAFGAISDQQWMGLSMMPNYYAALAAGADEATLLAAYQRDMEMLGPGMGQFVTSLVPGLNEKIRALVADREQSNKLFNEMAWTANVEKLTSESGLDRGLASARFNRGQKDVKERIKTNVKASDTEDINQFDWGAAGYNRNAYREISREAEQRGTSVPLLYYKGSQVTKEEAVDLLQNALTKYDLNIIIDGEKTNIGTVYANSDSLAAYNYMIGGQ